MVAQEVACVELQVFEVERRLTCLRRLVLGGEQVEQLLQELAVAPRELLERRLLQPVARRAELGRAVACRRELGEVEQLLGVRAERERHVGRGELLVGRGGVGREGARHLLQLGEAFRDAGALAQLERQIASGRAQRLVDARQHLAQPLSAVGREQAQALRVARGAERRERPLERLAAQHGRLVVGELVEARVEPDRERMRAEQARAEAVDGRDPRAVEPPCEVGPAARVQRGTDACAQLTGRLARVGDHEHRLDVEPGVADRAHEPLDEHRRLAGPCACGDEDLAGRLDGGCLLAVHARSIRHIVQRSHQDGQVPPFGSCLTSPARMRCAYPRARSREVSTSDQNSSSSR